MLRRCIHGTGSPVATAKTCWSWNFLCLHSGTTSADNLHQGAHASHPVSGHGRGSCLSSCRSGQQSPRLNNTAFLSDCQQLVHFLSSADQANPPDWRIKPFTQIFTTCSAQCQAKIYKINWTLNTTVDSLAKHAILESCSNYEPVCSYSRHSHQCPLRDALISITLQGVTILAASCC